MTIPAHARHDRHFHAQVLFDRCTHLCGKQRLFLRCAAGHGRCEKYVFSHRHESVKHAAAWLMAWSQLPADSSREHYLLVPSDADVALILGRL